MSLYDKTDVPKFGMPSYEDAELIKYYANCYYAARISFFNQMKVFADRYHCDHDMLVQAIIADKVVGVHGANPTGQSYGGNCLIKDVSAIIKYGEMEGLDTRLLKAVKKVNDNMKSRKEYKNINGWVK